MNAREFLDILHVAERLKDTPRHCTTSKGRTESVAEHSWRISLMAFLLRHEFPELDMDKVVDMCLIHDLGECFTGDIPTFLKTSTDRETEDSLLDQWVKSLPAEVSADLAALYREMEAQETMESKVYKAMDKLEALIQHNESPLSTWSDNEYELNKTYAFDNVVFSDWLMNLRKEILADTLTKIKAENPVPQKQARKPEAPAKDAPPKARSAKPRTKVAIRRPDRAAWNADGEFGAPVPVPAVPVSVRKTMEAKNNGAEARRNRALVADLERDAMIAVKEADMPTIHFPENDDKYNASRKHKETGKSKDQA
ncbi:HD domain-containing protein [Aristaeella hokkaidonensis]|uniref:HD domain-containing protein n=1 Tax=Aristaeella hokkaidonensis TaxID=3046382 RepID=A0AC61MW05_9FIRM|nr:HD domain-containing protein [Aristaeella hokkaidonensis]SNT94543.1 5'-deoxynucleotidase YfbR [Aristaeella hokkaidonensis]